MMCSIEVPVIRGGWLIQCIDSVLQQSSSNWLLSLLWDHGDALSSRILERVEAAGHPRIRVHRAPHRLGIARARQHLTDRSRGELILPLDDDDVLHPHAVARIVEVASTRPWAGVFRARRDFIDDRGLPVFMQDWFAFEPRHYSNGATIDISNHSQPYAIRRSILTATGGWTGFEDFQHAGEDCGAFMKIEELSDVELIDEKLYSYRIHDQRTSLQYDRPDADEMWRRIADESIVRRHLRVERSNDSPPFTYRKRANGKASIHDVELVVPFLETNEREVEYSASRPGAESALFPLRVDTHFAQLFVPAIRDVSRIEIALGASAPVFGDLKLALYETARSFSPALELERSLSFPSGFEYDVVSLRPRNVVEQSFERIEISFTPNPLHGRSELCLHTISAPERSVAMLRLFRHEPGFGRTRLDLCLASIARTGAAKSAVHIIEKAQSSSANRNEAFRGTTKPLICFLDDDAELGSPDTLSVMLTAMQEWGAGLAGPKLVTPSGRLYSGVPHTNPITLEAIVGGLGQPDLGQHDLTTLVPWLPSTVLLVERAVMHTTGGFDESYLGSQHEDVDFALRARARGFSCLYVGSASAIHHNALRNGGFRGNMDYLRARWRSRPDLFSWSPPTAAGDQRRAR